MSDRSTVAVIGSGAVGSYYGGRLAEAGHAVSFLMRREYQAVRDGGLRVTSPDGDFSIEKPSVFLSSEDIGPVDWVICSLKATSLERIEGLVRPCLDANTRVLLLMNGLGLEERFAEWFGPERVFGGLAFTCINRGDPGTVHHLAYGTVTVGHYLDDPSEIEAGIALWAGSKARVTAAASLLRARWEKLCWNVPFSGLSVAAGGVTSDVIAGDSDLRDAAREIMEDVISAANADLEAHGEDARLDRGSVVDGMFKLTDTMGPYRPSAMIDFVEGRPMEIEAIFGEPLRRARSLGVDTPRLALLTALLRALNAGR